jgi:phage portal protein BeeE
VSRYDVSAYLQQLNDPYAIVMPSGSGDPLREGIGGSFERYVRQAYQSNGVIFAVILARLLLFSEARFQWRRVKYGKTGELFGTQELSILEKPWPNGTTGELLTRMEQDVSLAGNFYCIRERDRAEERLRRLRPDWVEIVLTAPPDEAVESDVAGYAYYPGGRYAGGIVEYYLPDEMCHWSPIPDPIAQYRGMSWVTPVVREIEADQAATNHKNAFFTNGARPGLVVSMKESVTEKQFGAFIAKMNATHQGVNNAYKTLYVGGGADVTVAGADLRQLDFRATQGAGETRICAAGGVPPIIVGLSEGLASATYSNYGMARRKFGDHWARPTWRSACAALSALLDVPDRAELWYDDNDIAFLREDQKDQAAIIKEQILAIEAGTRAGFTPQTVMAAVAANDLSLMEHTGLYSVQLQEPGAGKESPTARQQERTALLSDQIAAIKSAIDAGFDADSAVLAVEENDISLLVFTGGEAGGAGPGAPNDIAADLDWGLFGGESGQPEPAPTPAPTPMSPGPVAPATPAALVPA